MLIFKCALLSNSNVAVRRSNCLAMYCIKNIILNALFISYFFSNININKARYILVNLKETPKLESVSSDLSERMLYSNLNVKQIDKSITKSFQKVDANNNEIPAQNDYAQEKQNEGGDRMFPSV